MDAKVVEKLTAPFPPELIGKLPRIVCSDCSNASGRVCAQHKKNRCDVCGNYITERHTHLDYVGHADVTTRLIDADPGWTWEPMATDDHGLPACDLDDRGNPVGMWIKLTVDGVTRLGYGSCPSNQTDAVKVLIGDALRNAAMRFGVATDLWAKGDRSDPSAENATSGAGKAAKRTSTDPLSTARKELLKVAAQTGHGSDPQTIGQLFEQALGKKVPDASLDDIKGFIAGLRENYAATQAQEQAS